MSEEKPNTAATSGNIKETPKGMPVFGASGRKIVYDENGKPCRTCNTLLDFRSISNNTPAAKSSSTAKSAAAASVAATSIVNSTSETASPKDCPPDVEQLGRSTWTLLHSIAATYPDKPNTTQQNNLKQFMESFASLYPCFYCAEDFREYMKKDKIKVTNRDEFGKWLCNAHNNVNVKLGKPTFDCNLWKERWKDGWKDGRCD